VLLGTTCSVQSETTKVEDILDENFAKELQAALEGNTNSSVLSLGYSANPGNPGGG
jgi:hypothetical protein